MDDHKDTPQQQAQQERKTEERRAGPDRRRAQAPYTGGDKRSGVDRRAFVAHQKNIIRQEQASFALRVVVSSGLLLACLGAAIFVMFAPEVREMQYNARRVGEMETQMRAVNERLLEMQKANAKQQNTLSEAITGRLEKIHEATVKPPEKVIVKEFVTDDRLKNYMAAITKAKALQATPQGQEALSASWNRLAQTLPPAGGNADDLGMALDLARKQDPVLADILSGIEVKNIDTGMLLVALDRFNTHLKTEQPFSADLSLLRRLSLGNTDFDSIVAKIMPYADSGIAGLGTLQSGFKEVAMDIVMSKLQGENLSVQEQFLKRMDGFVKMRKVDDIKGSTVDAIVARTDLLVGKGDIASALKELSGLSGAPQQAATAWMGQAQGNVASQGIAGAILNSFATGISAGTDIPVGGVSAVFSGIFGDVGSGASYTGNLPNYKGK